MALRSLLSNWLSRFSAKGPFGRQGEAAAERYLKHLGYKILARGARSKWGELDLVAADGRTVVFVEVKARQSSDAEPAEAVDADKQRRLSRLAVAFLKHHDLLEYAARFDVIAVTWPEGQRKPVIEHIKDAFDATGQWEFYS